MAPVGRRGFVASPRIILLVVTIVVVFYLVASSGSDELSTARVVATAIVAVGLLALFAILAVLSRRRARAEGRKEPI